MTATIRMRFLPALILLAASVSFAQQPISDAEKRLFLDPHLRNVPTKAVLEYSFSKSGSMEKNFEDKVTVAVKPAANSKAKSCHVEFLSGEQKFELPDVEEATSNPVVLSFLERDVREMRRITSGPVNYYRQRVRLALANDAQVRPVTFKFNGKEFQGQEIVVTPYEDDPARPRFERFSNKAYIVTVSEQIPGGVYRMRTIMNERSDTAKAGESSVSPMIAETLTFTGVTR